eukprot:3823278-Pyramimonas_sp.AAC.1
MQVQQPHHQQPRLRQNLNLKCRWMDKKPKDRLAPSRSLSKEAAKRAESRVVGNRRSKNHSNDMYAHLGGMGGQHGPADMSNQKQAWRRWGKNKGKAAAHSGVGLLLGPQPLVEITPTKDRPLRPAD